MASVPLRNKRHIQRSQSVYLHNRQQTSLYRQHSVKDARERRPLGTVNVAINSKMLRSPQSLYQRRRGAHRISVAITDSNYTGPSSPLLSFRNPPLRPGRRIKHAQSCVITPLRQLHLQDSQSSDESCNVAAVDVSYLTAACEITQLNRSPTAQRRKIWTLPSPENSPPDSPCPSRSQSPAPASTLPSSPSPLPPHFISPIPNITVDVATPPISARSASYKLKKMHRMRACQSTSALSYHSSTNNQREHVLLELIDTERRYISNIEILLNKYLPAVEETVAARDLRLLFPCQLEVLVDWHKQLLNQLEERRDEEAQFHGIVGDIFGQMCNEVNGSSEFINMYSAYMNEFKVAMQTLAKYEQSSQQFQQDIRSCQQSAECEGLSLAAYLLTPVQRLPRYELLLKELLKHTPIDHPDNYYIEEAVDLLRDELVRLNASIKSCELACSVTRIRNGSRSRSIRRLGNKGRMAGRQLAKQLMKHLSTTSVDDLSASDVRSSPEMSGPILRHKRTHSVQVMVGSNMYRSEENLAAPRLESVREKKRPLSVIERASSCIDLAVDYEGQPERKRHSQVLATLESLPGTPEPTSPTSLTPLSETEDSGDRSNSRASMYSITSSGIGSATSQLDLNSTLTLTPSSCSTPQPAPVTSADNTPTNALDVEDTPHRPADSVTRGRWKKTLSWASALVMPLSMRKRKASMPATLSPQRQSSVDISSPLDFTHVQHGFIHSTPKSAHPLPS